MTHWKSISLCLLALVVLLTGCGGDEAGGVARVTATANEPGDIIALEPRTTGRDVLAPDGRYSLRVPDEWVQYEDPIAELAFRTVAEDPALLMNVVREDAPNTPRVEVYAEAAQRRIMDVYSNVVTLSRAPVRIGNQPAFRWLFLATAGGQQRLFYQVVTVDAGQGFVLTGMAPAAADHDRMRSLFDSVAGTFTFGRG